MMAELRVATPRASRDPVVGIDRSIARCSTKQPVSSRLSLCSVGALSQIDLMRAETVVAIPVVLPARADIYLQARAPA
jgi:hypothetical protein